MALIEIDGLPFLKMGGFSMANCECHNQMKGEILEFWSIFWVQRPKGYPWNTVKHRVHRWWNTNTLEGFWVST